MALVKQVSKLPNRPHDPVSWGLFGYNHLISPTRINFLDNISKLFNIFYHIFNRNFISTVTQIKKKTQVNALETQNTETLNIRRVYSSMWLDAADRFPYDLINLTPCTWIFWGRPTTNPEASYPDIRLVLLRPRTYLFKQINWRLMTRVNEISRAERVVTAQSVIANGISTHN